MNRIWILATAFPITAVLVAAMNAAPTAMAFKGDGPALLEQYPVSNEQVIRPLKVGGAQLAATALSGTSELGGHTVTWSVTGASAPPPELADSFDGVVPAGATVTFSGSATFTIGTAGTNLSQSATLAGVAAGSFYGRVGEGTYTMPYSAKAVAPLPSPYSKVQPGEVSGSMIARVSSQNCNDYGVCGGPRVQVNLAVIAGRATKDESKPTITLQTTTGIHAEGPAKRVKRFGGKPFPFKLRFSMSDKSGQVSAKVRIFSGGTSAAGGSSNGFVKNGRYAMRVKRTPPGPGPFYWCAQATNPSGAVSPIVCDWVPMAARASDAGVNGCGTAKYGEAFEYLQNYFGNVRTYGWGMDQVDVDISRTCNVHDMAYMGVTAFDPIHKEYVDFRQWTRADVDAKFKKDIRAVCKRVLSSPKRMAPYLAVCRNGMGLDGLIAGIPLKGLGVLEDAGARTYYEMVRKFAEGAFDTDATVPGSQEIVPTTTNPTGGARDNA